MKKILCLILSLFFVFAVTACSDKNEDPSASQNENNQDTDTSVNSSDEEASIPADGEKVILSSDVKSVTPGQEISVTVNVKEAVNVACFDLFIRSDSGLTYESVELGLIPDFMMDTKYKVVADDEYLHLAGMTMYTHTFEDTLICTLKYKVADDVVSGETVGLTVQVFDFEKGTDESGAKLINISDTVIVQNIEFTVS